MTRAVMKLKVGDPVIMLSGKNKGLVSVILKCMPQDSKVLVQNANMLTHFNKPSAAHPDGGVSRHEAPVHVSNVAYYDAEKKVASRVGYKLTDQGKVRIAKKTGAEIAQAPVSRDK